MRTAVTDPLRIRPAVPGRPPSGISGDDRWDGDSAGLLVEAVALVASALAPVSWLAVLFGGWLLTEGNRGPEGMTGFAAASWLAVTGPVALLLTATAAVALRWRGSSGAAAVFGAVTLVGVGVAVLLWW